MEDDKQIVDQVVQEQPATELGEAAPSTPEPQPQAQDIEHQATDISDPFAELNDVFGIEAEEPSSGDRQVKPEENAQQPHQEASDEQTQFKYWQSEADKRTNELNKVLESVGVKSVDEFNNNFDDFQTLAPIAKYIRKNPHVLNDVERSLSNDEPIGQTQAGDQKASLKKPEKPTKPANYDPMDAVSDPESPSFKYRESMEGYNEKLTEYYEFQNQEIQNRFQAQQQEAAQRAQMDMLRTQLSNGYNFSEKETDQFIKEMSGPDSLSLDNLVQLWKIKNSRSPQEVQNEQKVEQMRRQKEKLTTPQPVGVQPGSSDNADKPVEDRLMDAMVGDYERQNPWT